MKNSYPLEYQMPKQMFEAILKTRNNKNSKMNPYVYVMNVINESFGLRGTVTKLSII